MAREAYYRRMAQRYRGPAAGSPDLEMAECWRAVADECDELAEAMNASPPKSHRTSMRRQPMQQQEKAQLTKSEAAGGRRRLAGSPGGLEDGKTGSSGVAVMHIAPCIGTRKRAKGQPDHPLA